MRNTASKREENGMMFDQVFKALGDPHRIKIMNLLREREMSAGEILETMDVVQSTLSHHMKTLVDSGAVNALRRGKWTYYSINEKTMQEAERFLHEYSGGTAARIDFSIEDKAASKGREPAESHAPGDSAAETHTADIEDRNSGSSPVKKKETAKRPEKEEEKERHEDASPKEGKKSKKGKKGKKNRK